MVLGPRIVFLIDRYQGENDDSWKKILANINLSCLRILCYYKHSCCARGVKSSILWGYKFFNSAKHQRSYRYKQCQFLEYVTGNFDKFENELYEGICSDETTLSQQNQKPGEKLKVALTEIITDFQWDRPDLFSPGKTWKGGNNEIEYNNLLFLFTNCPSGFYDSSTYFDQCYQDYESFIECLFPKVLFKKFVKHLKIKLCWIDTGICISNGHFKDNDHITMEEGLRSINGCFVEMRYLASWWVYTGTNSDHAYRDVINVSSLVRGLLDNSQDGRYIHISRYSISHDNRNNNAMISLCSIHPEVISQSTECKEEEEVKSILISEVVDLKSVSINTLNNKSGYFYVVNPTLSESNQNLMLNLNENCLSQKAIKIQFIPPNCSQICDAFMIPYTSFCGTIIPFSSQDICDNVVSAKNSGNEEMDDIIEEMESQFHGYIDKMKHDFGTSLVNSVDTWFLSNPKLGFPLEIKNTLCNLCNDRITMTKKREDNSKVLLEHMKGIYSKLKSNNQDKTKHEKSLQAISLGKQRLKKYRKKLKEDENNMEINENADNILDDENNVTSVFVELSVEFPSKDKLCDFILSEYETILRRTVLSPSDIRNILKIVIQYYKSVDAESYKESSISFLYSTMLHNVEDIRDKNVDTPKEELVKEYLLQVQLYLECIHQLCPPNTETILKQVVSFLRTVSFERSAAFVSKHLNETVLPRFRNMTVFLREIYENLMLDFPEELEESKDMDDNDDHGVSLKSVESSSVISYCSSEYSPLSLQAEKRTIRRIPSIVGDNVNKKVIAVQVRKINKNKLKKKHSSVSSDKVVKRTLFSQDPLMSNVLATPKPMRRYSESVIKKSVPDTPETKQINDMIWKKLERKRRYSNIDKRMISIEESPLKEIASPIKRNSSFYRSSSFNCHTSPRRFYTIQRHPSMIVGNHGFSKVAIQEEVNSNLAHHKPVDKIVSASPLEVKLRRRSTLFSNFDNETSECLGDKVDKYESENQVVPTTSKEDGEEGKPGLRRKIFENENTPVKRNHNIYPKSCKTESHISKRLKLSTRNEMESINENQVIPIDEYKDKKLLRFNSDLDVIENLDVDQTVFMTETTVDWLTEIEKDQSKTPTNFHDALARISNTPVCLKSPAIIKAGNESITVSPCLSASSLEFLEKAPIISPVITKRKIQKGRLLTVEYD